MKVKYILASMMLLLSMAWGAVDLKLHHSESKRIIQKDTLQFACDFANKSELKIKHKDLCYIFSAIAWQESGAGLVTGKGKKGHIAYGVFQNYLPTMRNRMKLKGINYSDKEIISLLNDRFYSATFAEEELTDWLRYHKNDMYKALSSYYAGGKWRRGTWYADDIMTRVKYLKENAKYGNFSEL